MRQIMYNLCELVMFLVVVMLFVTNCDDCKGTRTFIKELRQPAPAPAVP